MEKLYERITSATSRTCLLLISGLDESFNACSNVPPSEQLACSARADRHALLRRPSESGSQVKLS